MNQDATCRPKGDATLSVDLDNLWAYQRSFGVSNWYNAPSFLEVSISRILTLLQQQGLRLTAFVVGYDAEQTKNHDALAKLAGYGNEIGNHTYHHDPIFHTRSAAVINAELAQAEDVINAATGVHTLGFRGPAFCTSPALLNQLAARSYLYDASSFPTSIGPLLRWYQHFKSNLTKEQKADQAKLYGGFQDTFSSLRPFAWQLEESRLIELPVTTLPLLRLPIHMTYINHIADKSPAIARNYFRLALALCRHSGTPPSLLLHATDFVGCDDDFDLAFIPGMKRTAKAKIGLLGELLTYCQKYFAMMTLGEFAGQLKQDKLLSSRPLRQEI